MGKNHFSLTGIPLHPLGEMNIYNYYLASDSVEKQYKNFLGSRFQIVFGSIMIYTFIYRVISFSKMIMMRSRHLVSWCCFIPSIMSIIESISFMIMELWGHYMNCRLVIWTLLFGISISNVGNSLTLRHEAYLVLCKTKWVTMQVYYHCYYNFRMCLSRFLPSLQALHQAIAVYYIMYLLCHGIGLPMHYRLIWHFLRYSAILHGNNIISMDQMHGKNWQKMEFKWYY